VNLAILDRDIAGAHQAHAMRAAAKLDVAKHEILRVAYLNIHEVDPDAMEFNELVPPANRLANCPNQGDRRGFVTPTHIILHITGTDTLAPARDRFMNPAAQASAHYIVDKDGALFQLVVDGRRAFHAGIQAIKTLYDVGDRAGSTSSASLPRRPVLPIHLPRRESAAHAGRIEAALCQNEDGAPGHALRY
jgi:hypothetical protein